MRQQKGCLCLKLLSKEADVVALLEPLSQGTAICHEGASGSWKTTVDLLFVAYPCLNSIAKMGNGEERLRTHLASLTYG